MSQTGVEFSYLIWYSKCWLDDFFFFFFPKWTSTLAVSLTCQTPSILTQTSAATPTGVSTTLEQVRHVPAPYSLGYTW